MSFLKALGKVWHNNICVKNSVSGPNGGVLKKTLT